MGSIFLLMFIFQYGYCLTLTLSELENWKKQMKAEVKNEIFLELAETEEMKRMNKEIHRVTKSNKEIVTVVQDHSIKLVGLQELTGKFQETKTQIENLGDELNATISNVENLELNHSENINQLENRIGVIDRNHNEAQDAINNILNQVNLVKTSLDQLGSDRDDQQVALNDQLDELENGLHGIVLNQNETKLVILNHANQLIQVEACIEELKVDQNETKVLVKNHHPIEKDCYEIEKSHSLPGVYNIKSLETPTPVFCKADGWTVIQSRGQFGNPKEYFAKTWAEYVSGFGEPEKEFWLGLERIYEITNDPSRPMKLKIVMEDFSGNTKEANYETFRLENSADNYSLRLGTYSGTAGNSMNATNTHWSHLDMPFSTHDRDNDKYNEGSCSDKWGGNGGWWFKNCMGANLNGLNYADGKVLKVNGDVWNGILWNQVTTKDRSLKTVTMLVRPNNA